MTPARDLSLEPLVDHVLALLASRRERRPHPALPRRLDGLFRRLAAAGAPSAAEEAQDLIWAVWCDHPHGPAYDLLHDGVAAIAAEDFTLALGIFDRLLEIEPDWPEVWNKRATVLFALGRDAESIADIACVLEREPRHFGAMSGFGQILLRNGYLHEAAAAFREAVALNPHLRGVAAVLGELDLERAATLN